jgi:hypothetical protein
MPDKIDTKFGRVDIPSVEELRALGRERLMTYFLWHKATPPDDVDAMAHAAHDLLVTDAANDDFDWEWALKHEHWIPAEEVYRELGLDLDKGTPDESAA